MGIFRIQGLLSLCLAMVLLAGCEKMIAIPEPYYSITSEKVFNTDKQASSALAGIYSEMINGNANSYSEGRATYGFATGMSTILAGSSADELLASVTEMSTDLFVTNKLSAINSEGKVATIWETAYQSIYGCNAVLEGVAASTSSRLSDSARKQLTAESKFLRAFCYFYLTNFFGDVPLVLTTDLNKTMRMAKAPQNEVYKQIILDLKEARDLLPEDYKVSGGERVRANKWAAAALLARVYLYTRDFGNAFIQSGDVISKSNLYSVVGINQVFANNSGEAIWQLKQNNNTLKPGNATAEGMYFIPFPIGTGILRNRLSSHLLDAFEQDDERKINWIGVTDQMNDDGDHFGVAYFPYKYKTGLPDYSSGGAYTEYYMVLRLAEQYLIRAEAQANGAGTGASGAIDDLNVIRHRAGLQYLPSNLNQAGLIAALEKEWQLEFFCEWGHRWFNLKRTGRAAQVLSAIDYKKPWAGDHQLLYPLPTKEIISNNNLKQNTGY